MESGPSKYSLTEAELQYHEARALLGNPATENSETEYWITIAAENGNSDAMQMISIRLANKKNPRDMTRAKYWKERATRTNLAC